MMNLVIDVPDDLGRSLQGIASAQDKTIQELAVERLRSPVDPEKVGRAGSPPGCAASHGGGAQA